MMLFMANMERPESRLERKILDLILTFPERIDEMETRNENSCRMLAARLRELVQAETGWRP